MIREICKAGWLQQKVEKRTGVSKWAKPQKTVFLPEKWYVLCIHDDQSPFLEIYSNDEGVNRHEPLETLNLNECQYITTAIEDDRTFVIAFQNDGRSSLELAALSPLERREWMDMLRFKLTRLGCLESGSNIYSSLPMPPVALVSSGASEDSAAENFTTQEFSISNSTDENIEHIYEPPRRSVISERIVATAEESMAPVSRMPYNEGIYEPISRAATSTSQSPEISENAETPVIESSTSAPLPAPRYSVIRKEEKPILPPRNGFGAGWSGSNASMEITHRRRTTRADSESASALYDVPRALFSPLGALASSPTRPSPITKSSIERYDALPMESTIRRSIEEAVIESGSPAAIAEVYAGDIATALEITAKGNNGASPRLPTSFSFDNAGFFEDEDISRHYANGPLMPSPSSEISDENRRGPYSELSGRARMVPWSVLKTKAANGSATSNGNRAHASMPGNGTDVSGHRNRSRSVTMISMPAPAMLDPPRVIPAMSFDEAPSPPTSPPPAPPLPLPNTLSMPVGSDRVIPLKETEVERLRSEMETPLHVKAQMLLEHLMNENGQLTGLALVDLIGYVWIAGWMKRYTKQFSAGLHIGDRLDSIFDAAGKPVAVNSVAKAEQVLKDCWKRRCTQVSLLLKRLPLAQVYILKRASNGDDVGIALKPGKNEILAIEDGKAASKAGMRARCKSIFNGSDGLVNYFITEVNGRALNMFSRDNEAQKRLHAVGTEITILVQPSDFVKELRKKLKHKKGYKDYVIG